MVEQRYCNKCGYFGPLQIHARPKGGQCDYMSALSPHPADHASVQGEREALAAKHADFIRVDSVTKQIRHYLFTPAQINAFADALSPPPAERFTAGQSGEKCRTCNGHGLIGGFVSDGDGGGGYDSQPCPDCNSGSFEQLRADLSDPDCPYGDSDLMGVPAGTLRALLAALSPTATQAAQPLSGWIHVDDARKPAIDEVILMWVWAEDECETEEGRYYAQDVSQVQMGVYRDAGHGPYFDCFATPFADHEGVGYWMPLPPPPAALAQQQEVDRG